MTNNTKPNPAGVASSLLVAFGGKANVTPPTASGDAPRASGYLVRFTTADDPDASSDRDYFDAATYFGEAKSLPIYFHHGLPIVVKTENGDTKSIGPGKKRIGTGELKTDDTGIFIDAVLSEADEYSGVIQQLLDTGKLGWSSGAVGHLVTREPVPGSGGTVKANHVGQWLMAEGSLTHTPAEPRNGAKAGERIGTVKSLLGDFGAYSYGEDSNLSDDWDPAETIANTAAGIVMWRLQVAVGNILSAEDMTPETQDEALDGVFDEAGTLTRKMVRALASAVSEAGDEDEAKSAFARFVAPGKVPARKAAPAALSLQDQRDALLADALAYLQRQKAVTSLRAKSGRVLSRPNREKLESLRAMLDELLASSAPPAAREDAPAPTDTEEVDPLAAPNGKSVSLAEVSARLAALGIATA